MMSDLCHVNTVHNDIFIFDNVISISLKVPSIAIVLSTSRKHLRTKVTPDFHLTYSKTGGNLGSESNDKKYSQNLKTR